MVSDGSRTIALIFLDARLVAANDGADDLDQNETKLEGAGDRNAQHEGQRSAQG